MTLGFVIGVLLIPELVMILHHHFRVFETNEWCVELLPALRPVTIVFLL